MITVTPEEDFAIAGSLLRVGQVLLMKETENPGSEGIRFFPYRCEWVSGYHVHNLSNEQCVNLSIVRNTNDYLITFGSRDDFDRSTGVAKNTAEKVVFNNSRLMVAAEFYRDWLMGREPKRENYY